MILTEVIREALKNLLNEPYSTGKRFKVENMYALFFVDNSFQFAYALPIKDKTFTRNSSFRTLFSVFGDFQLISYNNHSSNKAPWNNTISGESCIITDEDQLVAINVERLIPSTFIENGTISWENLIKIHYMIVSIIAKRPELLEYYFKAIPFYKKDNKLISFINQDLVNMTRGELRKFALQRKKFDSTLVNIKGLYGVFSDREPFYFAREQCSSTLYDKYDRPILNPAPHYFLYDEFDNTLVTKRYSSVRSSRNLLIDFNKLIVSSPKLIPPQLFVDYRISTNDLAKIQTRIRELMCNHPELLYLYFSPSNSIKRTSSSFNESSDEKEIAFYRKMLQDFPEESSYWQSRINDAKERKGRAIRHLPNR